VPHFMRVMADPANPDDIRASGWSVGVHNDYRLNGLSYTFWLFTKPNFAGAGRDASVRGEGRTDADALEAVRANIGLPLRCPGGVPVCIAVCPGPHFAARCPNCLRPDGGPLHPDASGGG
jgi:hypothetical protein